MVSFGLIQKRTRFIGTALVMKQSDKIIYNNNIIYIYIYIYIMWTTQVTSLDSTLSSDFAVTVSEVM